jgi:GT2 family glycosyltransferase
VRPGPAPGAPSDWQAGVSVIIPARNAADTVSAQLQALCGQTFTGWCETIVVDNGSRDATTEVAESWREQLPRLRVVSAPDAPGAAGARNVGAQLSQGTLLLFCDADDVVDREWVSQLAKALRDYPAAGGSVDRRSLNDPTQLAWRPARPCDTLPDHFRFLPYVQGANCGVRRDVWTELGGFDESFRHSEDVAFFWRIQLAGYEIGFVPDAVVSYRYRSSLRATARQNYEYGKSHAQLYHRFAAEGMPRSRAEDVLREWRWITVHTLGAVRSRRARGAWLARAARAAGRLTGSLRSRTVYF